MALTADPGVGREFLGYTIEELVGRGGMGVVYRAYDPRLRRNVAVKLIAPELSSDTRFRERFLAETEVALSLEHPNVVPIHDAGEVDGQLYLVMRFVEGSDLKSLLRRERALEPQRAIAICSQVAGALDAAHARGLVHRDLKPSNVLLDQGECVYLADFGLSRRLGEHGIPGESDLSLGTPAYAAPEQILGSEADGRADAYSLGCLLHECLTGKPPFVRASDLAVLWAHLREEPPPPTAHPTMAPVLTKALAKEPGRRYVSCAALIDATRDALGLRELAVARRRPWLLTAATAALAIALAVALGVFLDVGESGASKPSTRPTLTPVSDSVQRIDPKTNELVGTFTLGSDPTGIAVGDGSVWAIQHDDNRITRIDPRTNQVVATGSAPRPEAIAVGGGAVWVVSTDGTVTQFDLQSGASVHQVSVPAMLQPVELATFGMGAVWVANPTAGLLGRINRLSLEVGSPIDTGALKGSLKGVAAGERAVWVSTADILADDYGVTRIGPATRRVEARIPLHLGAEGIDVGEGAIWVANSLGGRVSQIDSATNRVVRTIRVGNDPLGVAVGGGAVWVSNYEDGTVSRIDPERGRVVATIPVGPNPDHLAADEDGVWVAVHVR